MAKTNFNKVENLLESGLKKMKADYLDKIAAIAQKSDRPEMRKFIEQAGALATQASMERKALAHGIIHAMERYKDPQLKFLDSIGIKEDELNALLEKLLKEQSSEAKATLEGVRHKIQEFEKEYLKSHPEKNDGSLVDKARQKHVSKRFNVKGDWLPLK